MPYLCVFALTYRSAESGTLRSRAREQVLDLSDGRHDLLHIAQRSGLPFDAVRAAADRLLAADLLRFAPDSDAPGDA